ncbi:Tkp4 protein [Vanderwaltozyma polyspora DSM 70294]|uniref:Tkp4 protein n=1 Tax=Vanderwaltozyma polyspora (strain ATCC 22028 / DSM 70294 / BCRC 21397 / CBS 2163 / NBRC 10782 / NRRL Y-8283 / UCD 57-17) TaxID=436907 RepID=A7TJE2_VANPO|nr:Tkp4 protein [Vanderwaltozyma polyspora DSM 70294]EDO17592.1 Tkp4 protein [Vanderwaltozyma polyspora DSM 70294]
MYQTKRTIQLSSKRMNNMTASNPITQYGSAAETKAIMDDSFDLIQSLEEQIRQNKKEQKLVWTNNKLNNTEKLKQFETLFDELQQTIRLIDNINNVQNNNSENIPALKVEGLENAVYNQNSINNITIKTEHENIPVTAVERTEKTVYNNKNKPRAEINAEMDINLELIQILEEQIDQIKLQQKNIWLKANVDYKIKIKETRELMTEIKDIRELIQDFKNEYNQKSNINNIIEITTNINNSKNKTQTEIKNYKKSSDYPFEELNQYDEVNFIEYKDENGGHFL